MDEFVPATVLGESDAKQAREAAQVVLKRLPDCIERMIKDRGGDADAQFIDEEECDAEAKRKLRTAWKAISERQRIFLLWVNRCGRTSMAASVMRISKATPSIWARMEGPTGDAYRLCLSAITEATVQRAADKVYELGVIGKRRYKFNQGAPIMDPRDPSKPYYEVEHDTACLMRYLARHDRTWAANYEPKVTSDSTPVRRIVLHDDQPRPLPEGK